MEGPTTNLELGEQTRFSILNRPGLLRIVLTLFSSMIIHSFQQKHAPLRLSFVRASIQSESKYQIDVMKHISVKSLSALVGTGRSCRPSEKSK